MIFRHKLAYVLFCPIHCPFIPAASFPEQVKAITPLFSATHLSRDPFLPIQYFCPTSGNSTSTYPSFCTLHLDQYHLPPLSHRRQKSSPFFTSLVSFMISQCLVPFSSSLVDHMAMLSQSLENVLLHDLPVSHLTSLNLNAQYNHLLKHRLKALLPSLIPICDFSYPGGLETLACSQSPSKRLKYRFSHSTSRISESIGLERA